jgi:Cysteine-rich secretory protein family
MTVRRLLVLLPLVIGMLALAAPANAGPRTDAAFVRATNADRRAHGLTSLATSATLAKLARSHSVAMARKSAARYGGRCNAGALWHNNISKSSSHWVWLGQNVGCGSLGSGAGSRTGSSGSRSTSSRPRPAGTDAADPLTAHR